MRLAKPVRRAPDAPVSRCTTRPVPRAAPAPARPPDWAAEETVRAACLAAVQASPNPIVPVFCVAPVLETWDRAAPADLAAPWCKHAPRWGTITDREPNSH